MRDVNIQFSSMKEDSYKTLITSAHDCDLLEFCKTLFKHLQEQPVVDIFSEIALNVSNNDTFKFKNTLTLNDLRRIW